MTSYNVWYFTPVCHSDNSGSFGEVFIPGLFKKDSCNTCFNCMNKKFGIIIYENSSSDIATHLSFVWLFRAFIMISIMDVLTMNDLGNISHSPVLRGFAANLFITGSDDVGNSSHLNERANAFAGSVNNPNTMIAKIAFKIFVKERISLFLSDS